MKNQFTLQSKRIITLLMFISITFALPQLIKGQNLNHSYGQLSLTDTHAKSISGAELTTTLPAEIPAIGVEFDIILSLGENQPVETDLQISINEKEAKLQQAYLNYEGELLWGDTYPYDGMLHIWLYESNFVDGVYSNKYRLIPLVVGEKTFKISVMQDEVEIATYETTYNVTQPIPYIEIAAPTILYDIPTVDFGTVTVGQKVTQTFTITPHNLLSDLNLSLNNESVKGLSISPTVIGEDATAAITVTVTYEPIGGPAEVEISNSIKISGGGMANDAEVSIVGTTVNPSAPICSFDPEDLDFGDSTIIGTTKTMTLKIKTKNTTKPITLELSQWDTPPVFSLSPLSIQPSIEEIETELTVTFTPYENEWGSAYFYATIYANSEEEMNQVSCGVYGYGVQGEIPPIVTISPESWNGGEVDIANNNPEGTHATDFNINCSNLTETITLTVEPNDMFFIDPNSSTSIPPTTNTSSVGIKYKNLTIGEHSAKLILKGSESGNVYAQADLSITGILVNQPSIEVSATALTFTSTLNTPSETQIITVTAADLTADLEVDITGTNAQMFSYTLSGWINDEGGRIRVVYTPTTSDNHTAVLTVKSGSLIKQVELNGTVDTNPVINVDQSELYFYTTNGAYTDPQTVNVAASSLTSEITISITGRNNDDFKFTTYNWNPMTGGEINVQFAPIVPAKTIITSEATLVISADGITKEVALKGDNNMIGVEKLNDNINIFATNHTITVELNAAENANIKVFDIAGKQVVDTTTQDNFTKINLDSNAGVYIVVVSTDSNTITRKIVIK